MSIKRRIKKMSHYSPPLEGRSKKGYLLLDFNERTAGPAKQVKEALKKFINSDRLHVYPEYGDFEIEIAKYAKVLAGQAMVTNGGDQGIDVVCRAFLDEGDKVIIPYPEFAMHYQSAGIQGAKILEPKYKEEGKLPLKEILSLMDDKKVKLIIFSNPNNPTGIATPIREVEAILRKAKKRDIALLHDEAYFEFSGITCKGLINKYDNLYIIRTFAKAFGLVSARVGYVISKEKNIQELLKIRGPYDVNMFAKIAVSAALKNRKYVADYIKEVMKDSKPKLEMFLKEKGIFFYPSRANFLLLKLKYPDKFIARLKARGILVRPKTTPNGKRAVRISIGSKKDTNKLIEAIAGLID
ncbi:MAG: histidinol-phosphate transaminase [Candidatus Nealsonbacteria bacterium]